MTEEADAKSRPSRFEETIAGTGGGRSPSSDRAYGRGDSVGRYVVLEPLGAGGMGVVYKAFDPELDRAVAIKLLISGLVRAKRSGASRLQREAQAMAKISHRNVISVHDVGTVDGRVFFAMELVDGPTLGAWLAEAPRGADAILTMFRRAGAGIAAAHAAGVVHHDFKPDNVLVGPDGQPRVLDFGLARSVVETSMHDADAPQPSPADASPEESGGRPPVLLSKTGRLIGTPAYMAPEQFANGPLDERTDQFSFCVALYEALHGERPFCGDSVASLGAAVLAGKRRPESEAKPPRVEVSGHVLAAIERGLARDRDDRFASMQALLDALAPRQRTRYGALGMGAVALLGVTAAVSYGLGKKTGRIPAPTVPCLDTAEPMVSLWTSSRRSSIAAAFAGSGAVNGPSMGARVVLGLDGYAARWLAAAKRSCAMIEVERVLSDEMAFRSRDCLDEARVAFRERVEGFTTITSDAVQDSLSAVEALPSPRDCAERGLLALRVQTPFDPELRASVREVRLQLGAVSRPLDAGDAKPCLAELATVEARARALGHGPLLASVLVDRANCELADGDEEMAMQTRQLAFETALASSDDFAALRVAVEVAQTSALRTDDFEVAQGWVRLAEALAQRHGLVRAEHVSGILNVRGILASRQRDVDTAVASFIKIADLTRDDPAQQEKYITALSNLGVALVNGGRVAEAQEMFDQAVASAVEHWGATHPKTAEARSSLAQSLMVQGRYAEALPINRAAVQGLRVVGDVDPLPLSVSLASLGVAERLVGNYADAKTHYLEAYALRKDAGALQTSRAMPLLNALGSLALVEEDFKSAERWFKEAVDLERGGVLARAEARANLAVALASQGRRGEALILVDEATALSRSATTQTRQAKRGPVLFGVANAAAAVGRTRRARQLYAEAELASVEGGDEAAVSRPRLGYARLLLESGDEQGARALMDAVRAQLDVSPYPAEAVDELAALEAELDGADAVPKPRLSPE